jgi:uncharacterized protein DUF3300
VTKTVVLICAVLLAMPYDTGARARPAQTPAQTPAAAPAKPIPAEQLDSLVAPIALYPDPLLSQTLVASTYPLEIVQLQQWLAKNKNLKDKALADAAMKEPWDPSIQAMAALPDVVNRLANDIQWTTDLGNAFLAQQSDVMDAVQRMRKKAQGTGALVSNEQQKVETKVVENKTVVIVEQANPQVVYVPSYSPVVVYGPPVYPYPPIYYPYYPPGVVATGMISFGVGFAMGAAWGGGWGYHAGWGGNDIDIDIDNNFVRNSNRNTNISGNRAGNTGKWQHDSSHRGGAPYSDRATADRFGGTARGDSLSSRQSSARSQSAARPQPASGANRPQSTATPGSRTGGASAGANRSPSSVGSRDVPRSSTSTNRSAFGGSSGSAAGARSSSSRGSASRGGSRGGGGGRRR